MRRLGRAPRREAVRRALLGSDAIAYEDVLEAEDMVRAHANHVTCRLRGLRPLVTRGAQ
jgi:hypothetical protein